ncbi:MAG: hypothetical protein VB061_13625 [Christensenella sp.]|nr:hypothetical protein [Christensenella sp.]
MSIRQTQSTASPAQKRGSVLSKVAFALSGAAMTLLLSQGGSLLFIGAGVVLSFLACLIAAFRFSLPERVLRKPAPLSLALGVVLAGSTALLYRAEFARTANEVFVGFLTKAHLVSLVNIVRAALPDIVCILALFALFTWFYLLSDAAVRFVRRWIASSCRAEQLYLLIGSAIAVVAIVLVYSQTTAFLGGGTPYDVVYTTDSGNLVSTNSFFYVNAYENDIRQPLFAVFSMPFAVVSMLLGKLLFFVPNAYMLVLACVQAVLLLFGFTLFARVLGLDGTDRVLFLLLLAVSYPTLLFLFTVEQYVFSVFWVFVLLYVWHERGQNRALPFVAASGSLLTSGVLFPLLLEEKSAKERVRALLSGGLAFLAVFVVFARVPLLNRALQNVKDIASFAGEAVSLPDRALQFFAFVSACFARPAAVVDLATYTHASYQLLPVTGMHWLGLVLFALALVSAALNWRDRSLRVCSLWAAFSVLLLFVVGWGASENGMVLYTLYFFWAYAALLYALLKRVLRENHRLRYAIVAAVICILVCANAFGMLDLFRFAVQYYPV